MDKEKPECIFLNTAYGDGYWICNLKLVPVNIDICKCCKNKTKV